MVSGIEVTSVPGAKRPSVPGPFATTSPTNSWPEDDVAVARHAEAAAGAHRQVGEGLRVLRRVQVGAADAAGAGADQHLALGEDRVGDRVDDEVALAEDGGAHDGFLRFCRRVGQDGGPGRSGTARTLREPTPRAASTNSEK